MSRVTLKTTVPREVWLAADARAKAQGTTVAAVLRDGLTAWLDAPAPALMCTSAGCRRAEGRHGPTCPLSASPST